MSSVTHKMKATQRRVAKQIARYGQTVDVTRPGRDGLTDDTVRYKAIVSGLNITNAPPWMDEGTLNAMGPDPCIMLFDYLSDVQEGDICAYRTLTYKVDRIVPLDPANYPVAYIGIVARHSVVPT